jgi:hypothetical protein
MPEPPVVHVYLVDSLEARAMILESQPDAKVVFAESLELGTQLAEHLRFQESTPHGQGVVFHDVRGNRSGQVLQSEGPGAVVEAPEDWC